MLLLFFQQFPINAFIPIGTVVILTSIHVKIGMKKRRMRKIIIHNMLNDGESVMSLSNLNPANCINLPSMPKSGFSYGGILVRKTLIHEKLNPHHSRFTHKTDRFFFDETLK